MEELLLNEAIHKNMPFFGICRGIQLINALLGGTLYQDLPTQRPSPIVHTMTAPYDRTVHKVSVIRDTPLYSILKTPELGVNSYHHQAIKDLFPRLKTMAVAEDGLIEGVYMPDKRFICAVQWQLNSLNTAKNVVRICNGTCSVLQHVYLGQFVSYEGGRL